MDKTGKRSLLESVPVLVIRDCSPALRAAWELA